MTTKHMLLSTLILATGNVTLTKETTKNKPLVFIINTNDKNFTDQIPVSSAKFNQTIVAVDTSSNDNEYFYTHVGSIDTLINNKEAVLETAGKKQGTLSCVYCPTRNAVILGAEHTDQCNRLLIAALVSQSVELEKENEQLKKELALLQ